jgi:hypothetical protein
MTTKVVYNSCFGGFSLSVAANKWLKDHGYDDSDHNEEDYRNYPEYRFNSIERHNPLLVECVETLGDAASGRCARLSVAEIYGTVYRIDEYDGHESVIEPENQSWISV